MKTLVGTLGWPHHFGQPARRQDVARMNEAIEEARRRLDRLAHVVLEILLGCAIRSQGGAKGKLVRQHVLFDVRRR